MGQGSAAAANVIDLEAFRQRKMQKNTTPAEAMRPAPPAMFVPVPVWVCWVPVWAWG